jgi:hypothetical protein
MSQSKQQVLGELEALMREFGISASRLGRDICGDPSFVTRLQEPKTKITNVMIDRVHHYAVRMRGQLDIED